LREEVTGESKIKFRLLDLSPLEEKGILVDRKKDVMEVTAKYKEGVAFDILTGRHKVICDQPEANGGQDQGMTPPEFLLAALASCAGYYAAEYLKTRSLSTEGLEVSVSAEKVLHPARMDQFVVRIQSGISEERHRAGLQRAVNSCLVHNTLLHAPSIAVVLEPAPMPEFA
jgi:putative redox protein